MFETAMFLDLMERLRDLCHQNAKNKGFWDAQLNMGEKIALIHSELSEMFEAWRKDIKYSEKDIRILDPKYVPLPGQVQNGTRSITAIEEEVADVFIRLMDLCGHLDIDVGRVILAKMEYNKKRSHMHGGRKC